jgi:phage terminase large subunit-like protein
VVAAACERWYVSEVVYPRRIRVQLFDELTNSGLPMTPWAATPEVGAASANELWRAINDGRLAHDHHPLLEQHMAAQRARWSTDGSLRLIPSEDEPCDAAIAARMAWWTAIDNLEPPGVS